MEKYIIWTGNEGLNQDDIDEMSADESQAVNNGKE